MKFIMAASLFLGFAIIGSNSRASEIIGVDALMASPQKYKGKIRVEGAVAKVMPEKKLVVLLDRKEWEECGEESLSCAKYKLPVQYTGAAPSVKDEVVFDGEIKKPDGRLLFVASSLEKLPPRKEAKTKE